MDRKSCIFPCIYMPRPVRAEALRDAFIMVNKFFFFFCDMEWVQFDLDRHMGGSRPNAKDFVFVIPNSS